VSERPLPEPPVPQGAPESALDIAGAVRSGARSAVDTVERALETIRRRDPDVNAFTAIFADRALADARRIDARQAAGEDVGPLAGCPFAVKNLFDVEGEITLAGAKLRAQSPPAARDAAAVTRLKAAGAILIGALNMDEFAYGFSTENAHYGTTRNPHAPDRIAGGSSGGSAAAVACGMAPIALGSDTNGSIRVPAALCGVYGFKPTFGRLSRAGAFPFVSSLDHIGPFARSVRDLTAVYDALQSPDPDDPACAQRAVDPVLGRLEEAPEGLRVGVLGGWFQQGATPEALAAVDAVAAAFSRCDIVELPEAERARSAAFCITAAEGGALHLRTLKDRYEDYDLATRDRLIAGALLPASVTLHAQRFRAWFRAQAERLFAEYDLLLAPATLCSAPRIGQSTVRIDGVETSVRANLGAHTQPLSFIGLPVLAAPVARLGGLPLGVQIAAAPWREDLILRAARQLERQGVLAAPIVGAKPC
jgi:AtzE family amidohydrolase